MPTLNEAGRKNVSASIAGAAQQTAWLQVDKNERYTVSLSGTFSATVEFQRSFDGGVTPLAVESYTAPTEKDGVAGENMLIRLACPTTFVSGPAVARLGK